MKICLNFSAALGLLFITSALPAETTFMIQDDPTLDAIVAKVRQEYLATRAQNQPGFNKLDVAVLIPNDDGTWKRGSYGGETLHYPASTVKLPFMAAAMYWERTKNHPVGYLDAHVAPMIRVSDNVATGRVIDAITETTNHTTATLEPSYESWRAARLFPRDYLTTRGLLGNQSTHNKTYPTNSGQGPNGFETLLIKDHGRNMMQAKMSASLMLEIIKGNLEPRSTQYMRGLLTHDKWGGHSVLGYGVPPGTIYENKSGCAYDTLADIAYIKMPGNDKEMFVAIYTDAYIDTEPKQPDPYDVSVLGPFTEMLIEALNYHDGAPPKIKRDNSNATHFSTTGTWTAETSDTEKMGTDYLYAKGGTGETSATWKLAVPEDGLYEICVWYSQGADRAKDAPFTVHHDGGTTVVLIDQQSKGGRWVRLGDFEIKAGQGSVSVTNAIANPAQVVVADGVKATKWPAGSTSAIKSIDMNTTDTH